MINKNYFNDDLLSIIISFIPKEIKFRLVNKKFKLMYDIQCWKLKFIFKKNIKFFCFF